MQLSQDTVADLVRRAKGAAHQSLDPDTQVGCLLVQPQHPFKTISWGYNHFPYGLIHSEEAWKAPAKYDRVLHAEASAVAGAAHDGHAIEGAIAVITKFPCGACVRLLLECGITGIIIPKPDGAPQWAREYRVAQALLEEAKIPIHYLDADAFSRLTEPRVRS